MIDITIPRPVPVPSSSADASTDGAAEARSLSRLLAGYSAVLCSIAPDAAGSAILRQVVAAISDRRCRLGIVSAMSFDLPVDASACLFPTPLDQRARMIVERQRQLDGVVAELGVRNAETFVTAGTPSSDIREVARLWRADIVLYGRSAKTGLRASSGSLPGGFDLVPLGDDGRLVPRPSLRRWFAG